MPRAEPPPHGQWLRCEKCHQAKPDVRPDPLTKITRHDGYQDFEGAMLLCNECWGNTPIAGPYPGGRR